MVTWRRSPRPRDPKFSALPIGKQKTSVFRHSRYRYFWEKYYGNPIKRAKVELSEIRSGLLLVPYFKSKRAEPPDDFSSKAIRAQGAA